MGGMGVPVTGSLGRGVTCAVVEVAAGAAQPEIDVAVDGGGGTSEIDGPWPGYDALGRGPHGRPETGRRRGRSHRRPFPPTPLGERERSAFGWIARRVASRDVNSGRSRVTFRGFFLRM